MLFLAECFMFVFNLKKKKAYKIMLFLALSDVILTSLYHWKSVIL